MITIIIIVIVIIVICFNKKEHIGMGTMTQHHLYGVQDYHLSNSSHVPYVYNPYYFGSGRIYRHTNHSPYVWQIRNYPHYHSLWNNPTRFHNYFYWT